MQIIGLMGAMGAGKDTTADIIAQLVPGLARVAFADALRAEVERLRTTIEHVAAIAHCGGWVCLSEDQTIVYVRVLTVGSMPRGTLNASVAALKEAVNAARAAQGDKT